MPDGDGRPGSDGEPGDSGDSGDAIAGRERSQPSTVGDAGDPSNGGNSVHPRATDDCGGPGNAEDRSHLGNVINSRDFRSPRSTARLRATRFSEEFLDLLRFVRRPRLTPHRPRAAQPAWRAEWLGGLSVSRLAFWLLLLWTINLLVLGPLAVSVATLSGTERKLPAGVLSWFLVVGWAPVIEELLFRLGMRRPAQAVWLAPVLFVGLLLGPRPFVVAGVVIAAGGIALILALKRHRWRFGRLRRYSRRFPFIFHSLTAVFACLHLANYSLGGAWLALLPLLVLPQWITGLVLGWMRVRFGIGASIALHASFNAGPMLLIVALRTWAPGLLQA